MNTLNIGVIGIGGRGNLARFAHLPEKNCRIVAGADIDEEQLKKFSEQFGRNVFITKNYEELLKRKEIDAVFITTPDFLHEEQSIAALKAGKAVYLEKPMAITIEACDRILETAYETKSKLFLGHNMRHFASIKKMKELIDSGIIGEVQVCWCRHFIDYGGDAYFRDWHSERKNTTGLLLQKGAHDIDVIHWLMGAYTKTVVGMGMLSVYNKCKRRAPGTKGSANWDKKRYPPLTQDGFSPIIDVEDHNMIMMQLSNGKQASYLQCHYTPDAERNYTFIGTAGRIENIGDHGDCEIHVWTHRGSRQAPDIIYYLRDKTDFHGGSDIEIVNTFIDFIRYNIKTNTSPIAARYAVATGYMGHKSMRNASTPFDVPEINEKLIEYFENGQKV